MMMSATTASKSHARLTHVLRSSCLASGREYDKAGVPNNFNNDFPITPDEPTFYKLLNEGGWWVMTTGKDDLTKATQPGANGTFNQAGLGFNDAIRCSGKMDVLAGGPHEPYGLFLNSTTVSLQSGESVNAFDAHKACLDEAPEPLDEATFVLRESLRSGGLCDASSYPDKLYEDDWVTAQALTLLQRRPRDKPFFLEVSFPGPHPPFTVTASMRDVVGGRTYPAPVDNPSKGADQCKQGTSEPYTGEQCAYAAEIENLDRRMLDVLQAVANTTTSKGKNVIVCFASDHGTMLYDHGDQGKTMPWNPSASVPLVCSGPTIAANASVSIPVATMDLAGTFLDIAGVMPHANMTTRSLMPLLTKGDDGAADYRQFVSSGLQSAPFNDTSQSRALVEAGVRIAAGQSTVAEEALTTSDLRRGEADSPEDLGGGGYNWRMVVQRVSDSEHYKFICCKGPCNGSPSTAPGPAADGYTRILYNTVADPNDMHPLHDPQMAEQLRQLLPEGHCPADPSE